MYENRKSFFFRQVLINCFSFERKSIRQWVQCTHKQFYWYYPCKWSFEVAMAKKKNKNCKHATDLSIYSSIAMKFVFALRLRGYSFGVKRSYLDLKGRTVFILWFIWCAGVSIFSLAKVYLRDVSSHVKQRQQTDNLTINGVELAWRKKELSRYLRQIHTVNIQIGDTGSVGLFVTFCCIFDSFRGKKKPKRKREIVLDKEIVPIMLYIMLLYIACFLLSVQSPKTLHKHVPIR